MAIISVRWFRPRWWWRLRWIRTRTPSRTRTLTRTTSTRRSSTTRPSGGGTTTASSPPPPPSTGTLGGNWQATAVTTRYVFETERLSCSLKHEAILQNYHHQVQNHSVPKPKLCRTAKSLHGPHSGHFSSSALGSRQGAGPAFGEQKPSTVIKGGVSKTLSEKFSNLGMRNYSVFRNGK